MKTIEELLRNLAREEVAEFAVVSGRLPCVKVGSSFQPVDDHAPSTDEIMQMLVSTGGSRYVDDLGPRPSQWSTRVDGVGLVAVSAFIRDEVVQARYLVRERDTRQSVPPSSGRTIGAGTFQPAPVGFRNAPPREKLEEEPTKQTQVARKPAPPPLEIELDLDPDPASSRPLPATIAGAAGHEYKTFDVASPPSRSVTPTGSVPPSPESERTIETRSSSPMSRPPPSIEPSLPSVQPMPPSSFVRSESKPAMSAAQPATTRMGVSASADLPALLALARGTGASDLHVLAGRPALLRHVGELKPRGEPLDGAALERIVHAIVPPRLAPILDRDGTCDFALDDGSGSGRCRVNVTKQRSGYKVCIRLIPSTVRSLESLGLPEGIASATEHHQGLIVVTGPTGHGKTTTLAAIVDLINRESTHHIITVEDPVEYVHKRRRALLSQREVGTHTRSFANALKAALREDPDVIVIGELRDTETVRAALSASETGHLVIGTMNTPSAAKTIDRLIDLFPPGDQAQVRMTLAGGLRLIVSQRLIPNAERTGLVAAAELLPGSVSLWSLIRDNKTYQIPSLQQRGKGLGIIRVDDSLIDLVKTGRTSLEIAKQYAENADEVEQIALGKKVPARLPDLPKKEGGQQMTTGEAIAGVLGKAGNLFKKG